MATFEIGEHDFLLDGQPHRVVSGALHYFRVHPDQWRSRIRLGRMMGLNAIETYVPWNEHSPAPGEFLTDGRLDLARFLREVQDEGMHAIVRPGPYICAEFDSGGFPAWLLRERGVCVRSREPKYLAAVTQYLRSVMEIVAPLQIDRGGPVILLQVENEYGAYGDDHAYLRALTDRLRACGATVPLTTVDQPEPDMLRAGNIDGLLATGSFGSRATERLRALRAQQPTGPLMCSEFWCGWFDHWGAHHHTTSAAESAAELDELLAAGASVNIYMLHGGTNFGLTNGANDKGVYQPTVTSYDYDAPLDEAGRPTEKFWAFREVIGRYCDLPEFDRTEALPFVVPEPAPIEVLGGLDDVLGPASWSDHDQLVTMDDLGQGRGLLRYRTRVDRGEDAAVLSFGEVRDRAWVSVDGEPIGTLSRDRHERAIVVPRSQGDIEILVEDQGRVNYGPRIGEAKGLIGPALFSGEEIGAWQTAPVDLEALPGAALEAEPTALPRGAAVFRAQVHLQNPTDLAVDSGEWGKGLLWVNGFTLGRYWRNGPQRSLFVPAGATRRGRNDIVVLELEATAASAVRFLPDLDLGHTEY